MRRQDEEEEDFVDSVSEDEEEHEEEEGPAQPVSTISASTHDPADKALIDRYIESTIGFERMDIAVTAAAIKGAYSGLDEQDGGVEDEKYLSWAAAQPPWLDLTGGGVRLHPLGPIALQLLQRGGGRRQPAAVYRLFQFRCNGHHLRAETSKHKMKISGGAWRTSPGCDKCPAPIRVQWE